MDGWIEIERLPCGARTFRREDPEIEECETVIDCLRFIGGLALAPKFTSI